jgi:hypothetical protein
MKLLEIKFVWNKDQIANGFTKPLSVRQLERFRGNIKLREFRLRGMLHKVEVFYCNNLASSDEVDCR